MHIHKFDGKSVNFLNSVVKIRDIHASPMTNFRSFGIKEKLSATA